MPLGKPGGHRAGSADGDAAFWQKSVELFGDAAMGVASDWFADGEGFEADAAEGFGVGRERDDGIGDGHDLAQVAAVADSRDRVL